MLETKKTEDSQYARSLIEASLDPLVTISAEGKITDMNEATVNITGVTREFLTGTDFFDYFTEPQKPVKFIRKYLQRVRLLTLRLP
jgi:PAS domain S-box-containing protein